jgi:hypothetical protein
LKSSGFGRLLLDGRGHVRAHRRENPAAISPANISVWQNTPHQAASIWLLEFMGPPLVIDYSPRIVTIF